MFPLLIPDLPGADALRPWLTRIDAARQYSNFGPLVREFEAVIGGWLTRISGGSPVGAVTLSSGTAALELGLQAMDLRPGSRVALPSLTFPATAHAVRRCGHRPVLCDVDPERWLLTPEIARSTDCDAVLPVATFGMTQPVAAWDAYTADTGRPVLVDAASALGWQAVGRTTTVAFSLHATKPFGCGEGGLFAAADASEIARVRRIGNFGYTDRRAIEPGTNAKMSEYAAAVALAQLDRRDHLLAERRRIRDAYRSRLARLAEVRPQAGIEAVPPSVLCVQLPAPAGRIAERLAGYGVETRAWYCPPLHRHPAFADCERSEPLAVTESLGERLLGLPFHHHLSDAAIGMVVDALEACLTASGTETP